MNLRIPITATVAVVLASFSLSAVLAGNGWLGAGIGAVVVVTATGLATRMPGPRSALIATVAVLIAVVPLLFGHTWPLLITGLVLVAATAASATGVRWLSGFAVLAAYLATLLIFLNLVFASKPSFGHVIPSYDSVTQLGRMVSSAFAEFRYSPPVPDTRPVSLVGAGGIGLVAIMVDILAVRMRRPAVAGLPLLVLFCVPVASTVKTFGPLQTVTFALGLTGFLTLLSTAGRERVRMWGRLVTFRYIQPLDETGAGPDTRDLAASGRRIGLAAVCLAVLVPVVLPVVRTHDVFGTTGTGSASSSVAGAGVGGGTLDAMLGVQRALQERTPQPVLTYTTTAAVPSQQYFQLFVLNYNGRQDAWLAQFNGRLADQRAPGSQLPYGPSGQLASTPAATVTTTVTLARDQSQAAGLEGFLPVPYAPVRLRAETPGWAELSGSLMLYNPAEPLAGMRYTVTSREADPTPANINSATALGGSPTSILTEYGAYTGPDVSRLAAIARQHTAGAATPLQAAADLQAWFQSGSFSYTLNPNLPASHWLVTFLTTDHRGYCQQFAWAFAVLARLVGIPSRIAVGYTGGSPGRNGTWKVTTADTHAWPELYFPSVGWLRFEPTPHGGRGQGTATAPAYAASPGRSASKAPAAGTASGARGSAAAGQAAKNAGGLNRFLRGGAGVAGQAAAGGAGLGLAIGLSVLLLVVLSGPAVARRLTRRRRWLAASTDAGAASAAWLELTDDLADYGLSRGPGETPRAVARRVVREASLDSAAALALSRIAGAAERAQYARLARPGTGLPADALLVRRAIARSVPTSRRIRAQLLPPSTLAAAQHLLQRAGDMLGWLDTSWPALRRQLRRGEN